MIILSKQQIIFMHTELIRQTGGSDGIRDNALLILHWLLLSRIQRSNSIQLSSM